MYPACFRRLVVIDLFKIGLLAVRQYPFLVFANSLDKIETIERCRIIFGKVYILVSDQHKDKFQKYLDKNFL